MYICQPKIFIYLLTQIRQLLSHQSNGRCFSVSGPTLWNSLPDYLRDSIFWRI